MTGRHVKKESAALKTSVKKTAQKRKPISGSFERTGKESSRSDLFPIVGVGASAGGLDAFTQLLKNLPGDTGMAFILIPHLAPERESILTELLSKTTAMTVREVEDGMTVERNSVYVIPPGTEMMMLKGDLHLTPREKTREQHMPVDTFLESLAEDRKGNAIAVIMSGTGSDGSMGIRAIKAKDGIVFAQDESAKFDSMPKNAIATGTVDFVLPPDKIAAELIRISRRLPLEGGHAGEIARVTPGKDDELGRVFSVLGKTTGVDFSLYKGSTIMRRIKRRMLLLNLETIGAYVSYLEAKPSEIEILYNEILINVTSFFREPDAFEALKRVVFPEIMKKTANNTAFRVWVPGCSTGEEVYSIAIAFLEYIGDSKIRPTIQIFATDIDDKAVEQARRGIYPENIVKDVSAERLKRFFEKQEGGGYAVKKVVREICIFARHNLVKDPPFSKMDLISCRNVLIYFGRELQEKTVRILFYALNQKGFLLSGASETMGLFESFFSAVDKKNSIYLRKSRTERPPIGMRDDVAKQPIFPVKGALGQIADISDPRKEADAIVLNKYGPPGFVISEDMEILQFRGDTGPYLRPAPGKASLNLLKLVSEDFVIELRTAIHQAKKEDLAVTKENFEYRRNNETRSVSIDVVPFTSAGGRCFLILFKEAPEPVAAETQAGRDVSGTAGQGNKKAARLQEELASVKRYFKAMAEKYESAEEELRTLNEELESHNEEMQSINEELQTSSEELQSTNEELNTVNDELMSRNEEAAQLNDDLVNVLRGVEIPIVRLGSGLQIKRFNETAAKLMNLIPADVGRPIRNIRMNIEIPDLEEIVFDVIDGLAPKEKEVRDAAGRWYSLTIRPYRTADNRIDGVLLTLVDIDNIKRSLLRIREAYDYANAIVETIREPLIVLDADLRVITANRSFYATFLEAPEDIEGRHIYELGTGQWNIPDLMKQLREVLPEKKSFSDFKVTAEFPNIGLRTMLLNAHKIQLEEPYGLTTFNTMEHLDRLILLAIEDTTVRMKSEEQIRKLNESLARRARDLELAYHDMESFGYSISHDLRAPLRIIKNMSDIVVQEQYDKLDEEGKALLKRIQASAERMDRLVAALLELSKAGRQDIQINEIDLQREATTIGEDLKAANPERHINIVVKKLPPAEGDITLIRQVLTNLLSNAVKFTKDRDMAFIEVGGRREETENIYCVKDNGAGFDAAHADKLFNAFQRLHKVEDFEGIGIGLSIVQRIIQRHGGKVWAEGETGKGATFYFTLPSKA